MTDIIEQRTPEWHQQRIGMVTASRISDMLSKAKSKTGWGMGRIRYRAELARERFTGIPRPEGYKSFDMEEGTRAEPLARAEYEMLNGVIVEKCGLIRHPTIGWAAASPDGLVGDDGVVEFKCPILTTHLETLKGGEIPRIYELQRHWQLACTGRRWCDYVSFLDRERHPEKEFDDHGMRFFSRRMTRNEAMIQEIEKDVIIFLREVEAELNEWHRLFPSQGKTDTLPIIAAG